MSKVNINPDNPQQEAEELYPYPPANRENDSLESRFADAKRDAYVDAVCRYLSEINRLKAENDKMRRALEQLQEMSSRQLADRGLMNHIATEALKTKIW